MSVQLKLAFRIEIVTRDDEGENLDGWQSPMVDHTMTIIGRANSFITIADALDMIDQLRDVGGYLQKLRYATRIIGRKEVIEYE